MEFPPPISQSLAAQATNLNQPRQDVQQAPPERNDQVGASQDRESSDRSQAGSQVTFSDEARRLATDNEVGVPGRNSVSQSTETVNEPRQSDANRSAEIRASTAKSVSEALTAYQENSVI